MPFFEFFTSNNLWSGLFIGILWGFVLQKAGVCQHDVVVKLFLLRDFTVHKVGVTLLITIMILLHIAYDLGMVEELVVPRTILLGQIIGGLLMGVGIAISGYCPGTSAGALGEGATDALFFMLGMVVGSAFFAETFPFFESTILSQGDLGHTTIPELLEINHWFFIILFVILSFLFEIVVVYWEKNIIKKLPKI